ncbi:TPA: hypothetical protein ACXZPG_004452 [Salmonella enterica]
MTVKRVRFPTKKGPSGVAGKDYSALRGMIQEMEYPLVFPPRAAVVCWSFHTTSKGKIIMTIKVNASGDELVAIKSALALMLYRLHNPYEAQSILDCLRESGFPEAIALADELVKFAPASPPRL